MELVQQFVPTRTMVKEMKAAVVANEHEMATWRLRPLWYAKSGFAAGTLHHALTAIAAHPRCRVPVPEVRDRMVTTSGWLDAADKGRA